MDCLSVAFCMSTNFIVKLLQDNVVVFLHGFLGTSEDWIPLMKTLSGWSRCISVDLPGHGETKVHTHGHKDLNEDTDLSIEAVAGILYELLHHLTPRKVTIIGYSMGARIALYMALKFVDKVSQCPLRYLLSI